MALLNKYIKVKELTDNLEIDGIVEKYDDTSPYMFCKILDADADVVCQLEHLKNIHGEEIGLHNLYQSILVVKRVTKVRGFNGYYIQLQDVIEIIDKETYNKYIVK